MERLRRALLLSVLVVIILGGACWFATEPVIAWFVRSFRGIDGLVYTNVAESFFVRLKLAGALGFVLSVPWLLWQLRAVLLPLMGEKERRLSRGLVPFATLLFYGGIAFSLMFILPLTLRFLLSFGTEQIQPLIRLDSMISFALTFTIPFALVFQLPVVLYFLSRVGVITAAWLRRNRKYSVLAIFIISALLTPADVFSQLLMAAPLLVLYEISILLVAGARADEEK